MFFPKITANHKGYFEFRVCNTDLLNGAEATQECLDQILLTDKFGRTRIPIASNLKGRTNFQLQLPSGLTCQHCVFQVILKKKINLFII